MQTLCSFKTTGCGGPRSVIETGHQGVSEAIIQQKTSATSSPVLTPVLPGRSCCYFSVRILKSKRVPFLWLIYYALHFLLFKNAGKAVLRSSPSSWSVQFSCSVMADFCHLIDCSMPGFPVHHQLPGYTQTHVHCIGDAIQPSRPLLSPAPPTFNLSLYQSIFQWVSSLHQVAKVLEFQL